MEDMVWISKLAGDSRKYSRPIGKYLAKIITNISLKNPTIIEEEHSWGILLREMIFATSSNYNNSVYNKEESVEALKTLGIKKYNSIKKDEKVLSVFLSNSIDLILENIEKTKIIPKIVREKEIISDIIEFLIDQHLPLLKILPYFRTTEFFPEKDIKELLINALYDLPKEEFQQVTSFMHHILEKIFNYHLKHQINQFLKYQKNHELIIPLIEECFKHLTPENSANVCISLICVKREELSPSRMISIILQVMGGLFIKISQVIAEISPPALRKELRVQQDHAGGIFLGQKQSWEYIMNVLNRRELVKIKKLICLTEDNKPVFASASIGAIYELNLTNEGQSKLNNQKSILLKIQRPNLKQGIEYQKKILIELLDFIKNRLDHLVTEPKEISRIKSIINYLKKAVNNYAKQSIDELDFRREKKNAEIIKRTLGNSSPINVPRYFYADRDIILMEKIQGKKITCLNGIRYLKKIEIADNLSSVYLQLMFYHGIIWADPHPGNILIDQSNNEIKLIDLNPCFFWDKDTRNEFILFLFRLLIGDIDGILKNLKKLITNPKEFNDEKVHDLLVDFFNGPRHAKLSNYLTHFSKLLAESNIELKIEAEAAMRGIAQIYFTTNSVSSKNHFFQILNKQCGRQTLIKQIIKTNPLKIFRATLPIFFELIKNSPDEDIGPSLDERDIYQIDCAFNQLTQQNVCQIELNRVNPDDNTALPLFSDGSRLIQSAHLKIEIINEAKPASVKYVLEIPNRMWLQDRQEYIKLHSIGFSICLVECLEQLRRSSIEDYWHLAENWNKKTLDLDILELKLKGKVKVAARLLFKQRFQNLWQSRFMNISFFNKMIWKILMTCEEKYETKQSKYQFFQKTVDNSSSYFPFILATLYNIHLTAQRLIIQGLKQIIRRSQFEMNLLPLSTDELIKRMMHGLLRSGE